jgi:hypothetical protein
MIPSKRDPLLAYIADTEFAQNIAEQILQQGYVVLPGVLSPDEVDIEYDRMWDWVERVSTCSRLDPASWQCTEHNGLTCDPWPCSQRDMMQSHQAGWVFHELREKLAERVFEKLYGTSELHCSKDGFTLQRPTNEHLRSGNSDHFDQGQTRLGLHCIQGSVALTNQEHDDGCFLCWPGSHTFHERIVAQRDSSVGRADFVMLKKADKQFLLDQGINPCRVPVQRGDVILWRSDLAHMGAPPIGSRENFRAVVYVCMLPEALTPEYMYGLKQRAFGKLETGNHWPCLEEWFRTPPAQMKTCHTKQPDLTSRQRLLYGLDRYLT